MENFIHTTGQCSNTQEQYTPGDLETYIVEHKLNILQKYDLKTLLRH